MPHITERETVHGTCYEVISSFGEVWARTWDKSFAEFCLSILVKY